MSYRRSFIGLLACTVLAIAAGNGLAGTIAEAKAQGSGTVTISSVIITSTTNLIQSTNRSFTVQDESGAITVFGALDVIGTALTGLAVGDLIEVSGTYTVYNGLAEVKVTDAATVRKVGQGTVPEPTLVTIADFQSGSGTAEGLESKIVKLENVVFTKTGTFLGGKSTSNYPVKDANNSGSTPTVVVRISTSSLGFDNLSIPVSPVNVTGVFSQSTSGYQLLPRGTSDMIPVGGNYPPAITGIAPLVLNKGAAPITLTIQATDPDNGPFPLKYSVKSGATGVGPSATLPFCGTLTDPLSSPAGTNVTGGGPLTGNQVVFTPNADASGWFEFSLQASDGPGVGEIKVTVYIQDSNRVVITEIMYAPANKNSGEPTYDSDWEWVEASNRTDSDIYLGSLLDGALTTQDNLYGFAVLPANSTRVLMKPDRGGVFSWSTFVTEWSPLVDSSMIQMMGVGGSGEPRMNNDGDTLRLFDVDGRLLDVVSYVNGSSWPIANYKSSIYLKRDMIDTVENDNGANWQLSVAGGCDAWSTPGGDVGSPGVIPSTYCFYPPSAENVEAFVAQDSKLGVVITLVGSDPDGRAVTYRIVTDPASGTLTDPASNPVDIAVPAGSVLTGATVKYTPAAGASGNVTFTYKVNDGSSDSPVATVTVHIIPPAPDKVVITEIMYDPSNGGSVETGWEWVEVHNLTDSFVDLKTLNDANNNTDGNLAGMTLLPHETKVIAKAQIKDSTGAVTRSLADFLTEWSPLTGDKVFAIPDTASLPALNNTGGDTLTLIGTDNAVLDTVVYEIGTNGWPKDAEKRASIYLRAESLTTAGNDVGTNWALSVDGVSGAFKSATSATDTVYDIGSPGTLSTPLPVIRGDFDRDGDVDLSDFATFKGCVSGPAVPYTGNCAKANFDGDNDVDQVDFAAFQRCFNGSQPADPNCAS